MKFAISEKVADSLVKPTSYASTCRCASLCQGPGVNCKGCQDQNVKVTSVKEVYKATV